jgi:hypothetical protein
MFVKAKAFSSKTLRFKFADNKGVTARFHIHVQLSVSGKWKGGHNGEVETKFLGETNFLVSYCGNVYVS